MERPTENPAESRIASDILDYLNKHPHAQDTLEGIVEWWLLEQRIIYETGKVRCALKQLMETGYVVEETRPGVGPVYRMNASRRHETAAGADSSTIDQAI